MLSKNIIGKNNQVRLRNVTGIDCFINTSINCFFGVSAFIREGLDASKFFDNLMFKLKQALGFTQCESELDKLGNLSEIKGYISTKLAESGDESNPVSLKNLMGKILVFEELMFMKNLGSEVGSPGILRGILK